MKLAHLKLAAAAIIGILVIIVVLQNTAAVETRLLFATVTMPRAVLLFITLLLGFLAGILVSFAIRTRKSKPKPETD